MVICLIVLAAAKMVIEDWRSRFNPGNYYAALDAGESAVRQKFDDGENLMKKAGLIVVASVLALSAGAAYAAENNDAGQLLASVQAPAFPSVPLEEVLDSVRKTSDKTFLVDARVPPVVVVGLARNRDITFPMLLKILRNNGLAAVGSDDTTSIIPVNRVRQYPLPLLFEDDDTIDDEQWVTRLVQLDNANAAQMVPILRPLLPQQGHLAAHTDSATIIVVARYANVRRIVQMILKMDASVKPQ